jgi:hypothetical protein
VPGPTGFDIGEIGFAADVIVDRDFRVNVGVRAVARGVAFEHGRAQRIDAFRYVDRVAFGLEPLAAC